MHIVMRMYNSNNDDDNNDRNNNEMMSAIKKIPSNTIIVTIK